jgi:hypothetical protein
MALINPNPPIPVVSFSADLADPLSLDGNSPLVLFPVRLETRFIASSDGGADLYVRVYPDKVHLDTHEPELTQAELEWGKHFWEQTWRAGNNDEAARLAWRQLVERFDSGRAAWVSRSLKPLNSEDRPTQQMKPDAPLPKMVFPSPATKVNSWTRAPLARLLPKRWYVFGYSGGRLAVRAIGNLIPEKLNAGPDPSAPLVQLADSDLAVDDGMKWMVDFAEASNVGMGIRMHLTQDQAALGFDYLLVFGTKVPASGTDGTAELVKLLDAHHYTDGLSFVLPGTPSNNTPDAPSGFSSTDPGGEQSYTSERVAPEFQPGDGSNADILAAALGLRGENALAVANLGNANALGSRDALHMNRALWTSTFGYFLAQMMFMPLTPEDYTWARQHFIDYVRASGPLPALRIGKQPYGVLPVTSLDYWRPAAGQESRYVQDVSLLVTLIRLREVWRRKVPMVPRVGRSDNPDIDFTEIFSMDAQSSSYTIRNLMGDMYLRNLWTLMVPGDDHQKYWWGKQHELTTAPLTAAGFAWNPLFLSNLTYSGWNASLRGPLVQPELTSEDALLSPNYIDLLLSETNLENIRNENLPQVQPSLLYSLLRHSLLLEYWFPAALMGGALSVFQLDQEVPLTQTPWNLLNKPIQNLTTDTAWNYLRTLKSPAPAAIAPRVASLLEFRESLAYLKTLGARKLERLFAGTLDLCSHRLDAWITSFATKRLMEMRKAKPAGVVFGGYGWVINLKPAAAPVTEATPPGEQGVFYRAANNPGFTHTPSLSQAATVAVLRSGHLTHSDAATKDQLAIDLSSDRVRLAKWLLEGMRQGQPLGALLGYRFERRLQDAGLADFISCFREAAPLVAGKLEPSNLPLESIAANNVTDGLLLQRKWKASPNFITLFSRKMPDGARLAAAAVTLVGEMNMLDSAVDAVSDALLAESVHHAVQGNPSRTAASLDSVAGGEVPPPELDVVRTPRTGAALTHRVVTLFSGPPDAPAGWPAPTSIRAKAEPYLNAWAGALLGDPRNTRCLVERLDPTTAAVAETREIILAELQMSPIDFIYAAEGSRDAQPSEIEQRVFYAVIRKPDGFSSPDAVLRIHSGRMPGWPASDLSFGEFTELLRAARKLITGARAIDARDLNVPQQNSDSGVNIAELKSRADSAEQSLRQTQASLNALLNDTGGVNLESLRDVILQSAQFGIVGAIPLSATGTATGDRDLLLTQAAAIASEFGQRVLQLRAVVVNAATGGTSDIDPNVSRMRAVFGSSFVVLPQFAAGNASELESALADSEKIQAGDVLGVVTWFQRSARVREGVMRLNDSLRYADAVNTGVRLNLRIAQLPYRVNDRWIGLPLNGGQTLSPSRFALVVQSAKMLDVKQPLAGLLIDEWVEVVPNPDETTAVVFQYDQPDATPPQNILLAVPADPDHAWTVFSLQQVLLETLDLARIRAVDPDLLDEAGHYLPGLYFAVNADGETVSTDFSKLR